MGGSEANLVATAHHCSTQAARLAHLLKNLSPPPVAIVDTRDRILVGTGTKG